MKFGILDLFLALIFLALCGLAAYRGLVRSLMHLLVLYLATAAAGLLYPYGALFVSAIGGRTPTLTQFIVFWVLFIAATIALEIALKRGFPDTRLPALGWADHLLGLLPGIAAGLIVAGLFLSTLGYAPQQTWGRALEGARVATAYACQQAALGPLLGRFLARYLALHGLWMPILPPIFWRPG